MQLVVQCPIPDVAPPENKQQLTRHISAQIDNIQLTLHIEQEPDVTFSLLSIHFPPVVRRPKPKNMNAFPPEEIVYQTSHRSDNRSTLLTAVSSVFTGAAVLSFIVRIISRRVARAKIGWDDYLSFGSAIALIGVNIPACLSV